MQICLRGDEDIHISDRSFRIERNTIWGREKVSYHLDKPRLWVEHVNLTRQQRRWLLITRESKTDSKPINRGALSNCYCVLSAHLSSVKNMFPLGWILRSFIESNWRPKKLSSSVVALLGAFGLRSTRAEGKFPRPRVASRIDPFTGPVPPFVICTVSGRSSYFNIVNF